MRKHLIAFSLAVLVLLGGCADSAAQPSVQPEETPSPSVSSTPRKFTLPYQPNASLHPITGNNKTNLALSCLVYQGLFELDNTFSPHGVLCSDYVAEQDGLLWTFTLTKAFFSDTSAVTADDVVYSLTLARNSEMYSVRLKDVQSITSGEDGKVVVTLSQPNSAFPALLDIPIIRDNEDGSMPLGTGAYEFVEDNGPLRLNRTPFAPQTAPEEISLFPVAAADDLIYAFDSGEISLVISDLTGANALGYSSGHETFDYPTTTMLYVGFQTARGICSDPLIRQALSRSFDRDTVSGSLLAGHADATCLPFSPHSALHSAQHEQTGRYDPSAALSLLSDAGYTAGEDGLLQRYGTPLSLTFIVNTDNPFKVTIAEYLTEELAHMGISVDLQKLSWDEYMTALTYGNFDLYLGEVALLADFDLTSLLEYGGTLNYGNYSSGETSALLGTLRSCSEEAQPQAAAALSEQFLIDCPFAPLCFKKYSVLTQWQIVSGLTPTRQNPFYQLESLRFDA